MFEAPHLPSLPTFSAPTSATAVTIEVEVEDLSGEDKKQSKPTVIACNEVLDKIDYCL